MTYRLSPDEIKKLLPVSDGLTYYQVFGKAVAKAQLLKEVSRSCEVCGGIGKRLAKAWNPIKDRPLVTCSCCNGTGKKTVPIEKALEMGGWK